MSNNNGITFVGLDAHKASINVAVIEAGRREISFECQVAHQARALKGLAKKLKALCDGALVAAYEAGPCGYALQRRLNALGVPCQVVAPSLIPVKPGERVKTDRRDAQKLAKMLRAGMLTEVHPPTLEEEAVRDLTRAREDAKQDQMRARHRLSKMLLRRGLRFDETKNWTRSHRRWLRGLRFEELWAQQTFDAYLLALEQVEERLKMLTEHVEQAAAGQRYAEPVGWLRCLRGIDTVTAMTILAELHDFRRFTKARDLMAYLGLTPSEYSSGNRTRRGSITKAGNSHVRRVLVETAWNYRHRPAVSLALRQRRAGQPPAVLAIADRAQVRLHHRYVKLKEGYHKPHNKVTTAVARELVGFIWAVLTHQGIQ
jgi:transposase